MINATFAHSDGWNWNPPSWNHACVPFDDDPRGVSTISKTKTVPM